MANASAPLRLIALGGSENAAACIGRALGVVPVPSHETWFACGEGKVVIGDNVRGCRVFLVASLVLPGGERSIYDRLMMTLNGVEALALSDAAEVTVVMPYFPGARQDKRKGRTREGITAGLVARMLEVAGADRVLTVEIHNEAIAGMFNPRKCTLENIYLHNHFGPWLREQGLCGDTVVSPDVGGLERARRYAETLGLAIATLSKERDYTHPNRVVRSTLLGTVQGRDVLMVDDIVDTAGSVRSAVSELKAQGARNITVACVLPLLSGPAWARLRILREQAEDEGWRFTVVGTSAVKHSEAPSWYRSYSLEPLLAQVIRSIHSRGSVTRVQDGSQVPDEMDGE